ncbi:antibiotic biosynthesis monooxygenase [Streptomyces agglomeratus]|uniref:antibiotic biosynthesis monooxygenase n=1 Tax=Streptomyces agglomeratus TaxID=285458 RepID=UPI0009A0389F|nr:antibiotic biosynthesis monooxygenase [Streptomyces agglomeratus]
MAWLDHKNKRRRVRAHRPGGQVIPEIEERRIPGFQSIDLIRREREGEVEFMALMWFDDLASGEAFMGADYEKAHVPAAARAMLSDFEERSAHFEVLDRRQQSH